MCTKGWDTGWSSPVSRYLGVLCGIWSRESGQREGNGRMDRVREEEES